MDIPFVKKKEPIEPIAGIFCEATDYRIYEQSFGEKAVCFIVGALVGFALGWIFYESLILSILVAIICGFAFIPIRRKQVINKRRDKLQLQFRDMLESLSTSLGAGSNVVDAFLSAAEDMRIQYGAKSSIVQELNIINAGVANNVNVEDLLLNFGERSQLEDIVNFANVFDTCYRKGGNINEVLKNTRSILSDKMAIALEIKTMVASKTTEQNAMLVMPVVFVFLLKMMGSDMVDLTSPVGRISTTIAIVLFIISYLIGKKILAIKV